ncbi:hypothetical protein [Deinococcus actinosclerus]|uniref:hypothetical protein n=1 Tax=Deinococcus actinosclerus TaxID=1768108 RepID=UPI0012FB9423|nr:hypothetical protein [Deinococcus actinosclerus]
MQCPSSLDALSAQATDVLGVYALLDDLARRQGGLRVLSDLRREDCPPRGVYFMYESGEDRTITGSGPRVVRIGTHAVSRGSRASLWTRLAQHRGSRAGSGNHRASILRRHVGEALIARGDFSVPSWGSPRGTPEGRAHERPLEEEVSRRVGAMQVLLLPIPDPPGPDSERALIERGVIGLLSQHGEPASGDWLGRHASTPEIARSGLWNVRHVHTTPPPNLLDTLERLVSAGPVAH